MGAVNFNVSNFRVQFPAFQSIPAFPDITLQGYFALSTVYINNRQGGCFLGGLSLSQLTQALYLMTAHLTAISVLVSQAQTIGVMTAATVDKVSVTLEPPPASNQWQYWLQSTPYGQQLLALLQVVSVGGVYLGARPELSAFRRPTWW